MSRSDGRQRCYTFAVYLTAPEPVDENDVDGYTPAEVEALLKRTLSYYAAPLNKERRIVQADWELLEVTDVPS